MIVLVKINWDESITGDTGSDTRILVKLDREPTKEEEHIIYKLLDDEYSYSCDAEQYIKQNIVYVFALLGIKAEPVEIDHWIEVDGKE